MASDAARVSGVSADAEGERPVELLLEFARARETDDRYAFRFTPQEYVMRARSGRYETATFAWSAEVLALLEAIRSPRRRPSAVAEIGRLLSDFVRGAGWAEVEQRIAAASAESRRVHVTVRSAAAELYALPWEFLPLSSSGLPIGQHANVLIE